MWCFGRVGEGVLGSASPGLIKGQPSYRGHEPAKMVLSDDDKARVRAAWVPVCKNSEMYGSETLTR